MAVTETFKIKSDTTFPLYNANINTRGVKVEQNFRGFSTSHANINTKGVKVEQNFREFSTSQKYVRANAC